MLLSTKSIVLKCIKYGESTMICHVLTEAFGRESFIVNISKKKSNHSFYQPGNLLLLHLDYNELKKIHRIKEAEWHFIYQQTHQNISKNCVAMFVIDVVTQSISHPEKNAELFDFILETLLWNDEASADYVKNIPLYFVYCFLKLLGHDFSFDLTKDIVRQQNLQGVNEIEIAQTIAQLDAVSESKNWAFFSVMPLQRKALFDILLWHFSYLVPNFKTPPSLRIIKTILYDVEA